MMHDLFLRVQEVWLMSVGGPEILGFFRVITGTLSLLAAGASVRNAVANLEMESTWTPWDCKRFKVINWIKTLGLILAALYYFCAGLFEIDRTSSPLRLILGNVAFSVMFLGILMDAQAWRVHYKRKRRLLGEEK